MPASTTPSRPIQTSRTPSKPTLNNDQMDSVNPQQWLNFSLPPRARYVPGSGGPQGLPRRSRRGEGWRGSAMTREKYVNASFRFVLKPTQAATYGAHFADPDISLHWPNILQVLVPTFSALSVAQGYVSLDPSSSHARGDEFGTSWESSELEGMGEGAAERRRRMEEEKQGRTCPICLGKPVAGRMTKCGHIFCFPCILHFIQLSDIPKSARCPICGDTVHEGMLKSVRYLDASTMINSVNGEDDDSVAGDDESAAEHDHVLGQMEGFEESTTNTPRQPSAPDHHEEHRHQIHMRLVQRPQMTTLALPLSSTWPSDALPPHTAPWYFLPDAISFSKHMLATPEYMRSELHRELEELQVEWDNLKGDTLGRDFVRAAREKVERQVGKVKAELETESVRRGERACRDAWGEAVGGEKREREKRRERERRAKEREERSRLEAQQSDTPTEYLASQQSFDPNVNIPPNIDVQPNPMPSKRNKRKGTGATALGVPASAPPPSYFFYQSALGANVFLHPLDIRILLAHFKSYSLFPTRISFTSSGFDPGTITDELRKRCKYLGHLPAGTEVVFVEADLEEIVGKEGLAAFEQPLKARAAKRRERVKKDDRAKSKWEKSEREKNPVDTRTSIPSAAGEDREFALALARSTADDSWRPDEFQSGSASSSSSHPLSAPPRLGDARPAISSSPTQSTWGDSRHKPSFATALHYHTTSSAPVTSRQEIDWEVEEAWDAFDRMSVGEGTARESEKGGGERGKKGKKGSKKLVLGGGGRRA